MSNTNSIDVEDFAEAWALALNFVTKRGESIVFGDPEEPKPAKDSCQLIRLSGNAIKQIKAKICHPDYPFSGKRLSEYCKTFTREYVADWNEQDVETRFSYLYMDRFISPYDQVQLLRTQLKVQKESGVNSNRHIMTTWRPSEDLGSGTPPCLQIVQVRYQGNNKVSVWVTWRSRDLFSAWQSNVIALVDMLYREVLTPNGCEIGELIDFSTSLHIYESDLTAATKVPLPVKPAIPSLR